MAEEIILKITADIDEVKRKLDSLEKSMDNVQETTKEASENVKELGGNLDKATGGMVSMWKAGVSGAKSFIAGMRTLKGAIISTGIGALLIAVTSLVAYFQRTERGAQALRVITATLGAVMDKLTDVVIHLGEKIFKMFTDPQTAIEELGKQISYYFNEFIPNAVKKVIEGFGLLGKSISQLFKGDFEGAAATALEGVVMLGDGLTDLNPMTAVIKTVATGLYNLGVEAKASGEEVNKLERALNAVILAERKLLVERAAAMQKIAQLRLEAQDLDLPLEERIAKLTEANDLENSITAKQINLENERLRIMKAKAAQAESDEATMQAIAEQEAKIIDLQTSSFMRQKEIVAQVAGMRKQAQAEEIARQKELIELEKQRQALALEAAQEQVDAIAKIEQATLSAYDKEWQAAYDHYQELILLAEKYGLDTIALRDRQAQAVAEVELKYAKEASDKTQAIKQAEAQAISSTTAKMFESLTLLSEENTAAQKATSVAAATWNTFQAVTAALGQVPYTPANIAQAVATGAFGLLQVKKILSTNVGSGGGGSIASASGTQIAQNTPQFQLNSLINGQSQNQLQRAYVVGGDVTTQQALDRRIRLAATFG